VEEIHERLADEIWEYVLVAYIKPAQS